MSYPEPSDLDPMAQVRSDHQKTDAHSPPLDPKSMLVIFKTRDLLLVDGFEIHGHAKGV
jgi:hypothetical protein